MTEKRKIRSKDEIVSVTADYYKHSKSGVPHPYKWFIKTTWGIREFGSYGDNPETYPYPVEKLPKAVQEFMKTAKEKETFGVSSMSPTQRIIWGRT